MQPYLQPREKPAHGTPLIWRPASVPIPNVAYLMLPQERGGAILHDWQGARHSTAYVGTVAWANGCWGPFINLTPNAYVSLPTTNLLSAGNGPFTVSGIYRTTLTTAECIYGEGSSSSNNQRLTIMVNQNNAGNSSGAVRFFVVADDNANIIQITAAGTSNDGLNHMITAVSQGNGGSAYLYVDGVQVATGAVATNTITCNMSAIACYPRATPAYYWSGDIGGIWLWRRALAAAEVAAHYADPYMWLREPRRVWMPVTAAAAGNPWYAHAQQ